MGIKPGAAYEIHKKRVVVKSTDGKTVTVAKDDGTDEVLPINTFLALKPKEAQMFESIQDVSSVENLITDIKASITIPEGSLTDLRAVTGEGDDNISILFVDGDIVHKIDLKTLPHDSYEVLDANPFWKDALDIIGQSTPTMGVDALGALIRVVLASAVKQINMADPAEVPIANATADAQVMSDIPVEYVIGESYDVNGLKATFLGLFEATQEFLFLTERNGFLMKRRD